MIRKGEAPESLPHIEAVTMKMPTPRPQKMPKSPYAKRKASFFLGQKTHEHLMKICKENNISQQQIFEESLNGWLRAMGEPSADELEKSE